MKKILTYCMCLLWLPATVSAQPMEVDLQKYDYKAEDFHYSRIYLYFLGSTVPYEMLADSTYKVKLYTTIVLKDGEKVLYAERHRLTSHAEYPTDFTDSYEFKTRPGKYTLEYRVKATEDDEEFLYTREQELVIRDFADPDISDILLLQSFREDEDTVTSFSINDIYVELLPFNFVPDAYDNLSYFYEYYPDSDQGEVFVLEQIDKYGKGEWSERAKTASPFTDKTRITPIFKRMNIVDLESGEYRLRIDILTRSMDTLASSVVYFIRSNPQVDITLREEELRNRGRESFVEKIPTDELIYSLRAVAPIVPQNDVITLNYVLKQKEEEGMKAFLYNFWKTRASVNTEIAYENYMEVARAVDKSYYNAMGYGFETDRGRIFLQYGRPTEIITSEQEIASVPYEIWTYDYTERTKQSDVRFVFYNPSLVSNGFQLLHSTARGEISNPRWELYIYGNAPDEIDGKNFLDSRRMQDNINRNARRFYEDN